MRRDWQVILEIQPSGCDQKVSRLLCVVCCVVLVDDHERGCCRSFVVVLRAFIFVLSPSSQFLAIN